MVQVRSAARGVVLALLTLFIITPFPVCLRSCAEPQSPGWPPAAKGEKGLSPFRPTATAPLPALLFFPSGGF